MAYIDREYILSFITEGDLDTLTAGDDAEANLTNAIERADDLINSYLSNQMTVPLTEAPVMIKGISVDLTIYYLHSKTQSNNLPEQVVRKYEDAILLLKDLSAGKAKLNFTSDEPEQSAIIKTSGDEPVMSRDMF